MNRESGLYASYPSTHDACSLKETRAAFGVAGDNLAVRKGAATLVILYSISQVLMTATKGRGAVAARLATTGVLGAE
jgi:hypothetical protein